MPKTKEQYFQQIADCGVIAVIRAPSKEVLPEIAQALVAGGVLGIEVTMSTPKAIEGIEMLADAMGDKIAVGVEDDPRRRDRRQRHSRGGAVRRLARVRPGHRRNDQALREDQRPRRVHADRDRPRVVGRRGRRQGLPVHRARPRVLQGHPRAAAADQADADRRRRREERR
jgi:hypothetical protein